MECKQHVDRIRISASMHLIDINVKLLKKKKIEGKKTGVWCLQVNNKRVMNKGIYIMWCIVSVCNKIKSMSVACENYDGITNFLLGGFFLYGFYKCSSKVF